MWKFQCLLRHMWWLTITPIGTPWSIKPMILGDTTKNGAAVEKISRLKTGSVMAVGQHLLPGIFGFCCGQEEFWLHSAYLTLPLKPPFRLRSKHGLFIWHLRIVRMVWAIGTVCGLIPSTFGRKKRRFWRFERGGKICMHLAHLILPAKSWQVFDSFPTWASCWFREIGGWWNMAKIDKNTYLMRSPEISCEFLRKKILSPSGRPGAVPISTLVVLDTGRRWSMWCTHMLHGLERKGA